MDVGIFAMIPIHEKMCTGYTASGRCLNELKQLQQILE